ncbi:hypothetical protein LCGC14_1321820 [marine sediment metagenome]|uniref:Uncharacterized protein n=1 Tax=marine sediment metagenome TaxID=412755 RepID=A0A0F9L4R5_9ZZZZ
MKKPRKIHLRDVVDLEAKNFNKEFQLDFYDHKKKLHVVLHLPQWWIKYIAKDLWSVIEDEQEELNKIKDSMRLE